MIKIGFIQPEMQSRGGVQTFMHDVARTLCALQSKSASAGAYLRIVLGSLNDSGAYEFPSGCSKNHSWASSRSKLSFLLSCAGHIRGSKVLIVGHVGLSPIALVLQLLGQVENYIVILHGIEAWRRMHWLDRAACQRASRVICTTRHTAEVTNRVNCVPLEKIDILPLATRPPKIVDVAPLSLRGTPKLLMVGRQDATEMGKGFETCIKAVSRLILEFPTLHLTFAGPSKDNSWLLRLIESNGLSSSISVIGPLSESELHGAYKACDIFIMPSKKEGFGITFLEAMAFGKPCIGGNHGGTPEVIVDNETGFLCNFDDDAALAEHIKTLCNDKVLAFRMGAAGARRVIDVFSMANFEENLGSIISPLLAS